MEDTCPNIMECVPGSMILRIPFLCLDTGIPVCQGGANAGHTIYNDKEAELGGDMIGTIKRGIGLCYASKAIHNGLRVGDLRHMDTFRSKLEILFKDAAN
ncbi:unnamed protein product [Sphagnum balticum]